jgi:cysteine-rich repeat protein
MRPLLPLMWLVACTSEDQQIELAVSDPSLEGTLPGGEAPPPFHMALEGANFVEGEFGLLTATGLPVGAHVRVAWGDVLGAGPCAPALGGRCISIAQPVRVSPTTVVSLDGEATFGIRVPRGSAGRTIAVQLGLTGPGARISNPIIRKVAPVGTVIAGDVDADGDGFTPDEGDCADFDTSYHPDAVDALGDGLDPNCDNFDGYDDDGDGCEDTLGCAELCGDGRVVGAEECDDDNRAADDGCASNCTIEANTTCDTSEPSVCDVDRCATSPCFAGVACTDAAAPAEGFVCDVCPVGYTGDGVTCTNFDACLTNPCFTGVTCTDVPAPGTGFSCGPCPEGFTGDGITCLDTLGSADNVAMSCQHIKAQAPGSPTGLYWVNDNAQATAYQTWCDMTTDGGGWNVCYSHNIVDIEEMNHPTVTEMTTRYGTGAATGEYGSDCVGLGHRVQPTAVRYTGNNGAHWIELVTPPDALHDFFRCGATGRVNVKTHTSGATSYPRLFGLHDCPAFGVGANAINQIGSSTNGGTCFEKNSKGSDSNHHWAIFPTCNGTYVEGGGDQEATPRNGRATVMVRASVPLQTGVGSQSNPGLSCLDVRDRNPGVPDGVYWITDGGQVTAYKAFCDMTTDGGGWTVCYNHDMMDAEEMTHSNVTQMTTKYGIPGKFNEFGTDCVGTGHRLQPQKVRFTANDGNFWLQFNSPPDAFHDFFRCGASGTVNVSTWASGATTYNRTFGLHDCPGFGVGNNAINQIGTGQNAGLCFEKNSKGSDSNHHWTMYPTCSGTYAEGPGEQEGSPRTGYARVMMR